jgi:hypothetical protein
LRCSVRDAELSNRFRPGSSLIRKIAAQNQRAMMKNLQTMLLAAGVFAVFVGLVWIGQGTGYFPYPSSSFMIDQMPWAYGGAAVAVLGLIAIFISRRIS